MRKKQKKFPVNNVNKIVHIDLAILQLQNRSLHCERHSEGLLSGDLGVLKPGYVRAPSSVAEWEGVSRDFEHLWNFPHCIGMVHNGKTLVNIIYC